MKLLILCNDRLALPALNQLLQMNIVAGVGMTARQSEVHHVVRMLCNQYKVPLRLFRKNTFSEDLEKWLIPLRPDVVLVKTFPWKIPDNLLSIPAFGFINFHYAPLPEYRGANPLFWMIRDGIKESGVTVHQMTAAFDDGPVLLQSRISVPPNATFGMLVSALAGNGLELTAKLLQEMQTGQLNSTPQDRELASWYGRPAPKDLWLNWQAMDAMAVRRMVNACNPWNKGAPATLNGWTVGLTYVTPVTQEGLKDTVPGTILSVREDKGLRVACKDDSVIRVDVVFTEEGFLPGFALADFGIKSGMLFS